MTYKHGGRPMTLREIMDAEQSHEREAALSDREQAIKENSERASVCTKIYNSIPVQAYTIKCSACKQNMAVATAPTFCPACGEKFTEWRDESEPRA